MMLHAHGLTKSYRQGTRTIEAVAGVDMEVAAGQFVAVCGQSGSGKSSLLAMLGGLTRPTSGRATFEDRDLWSLSSDARAELRQRRIGFVFQFASLLPALRIIDNVALPALLSAGADLDVVYRRAGELLARVGLGDRQAAYPGELSGGQQRRVALARALVMQPAVLLADEPTADLDEESEAEIFRMLLDWRAVHHGTLLVVTHNSTLARQADRIIYLRKGRIVGSEAPEPDLRIEVPAPSHEIIESAALPTSPPMGANLLGSLATLVTWTALVVVFLVALNWVASVWQARQTREKLATQLSLASTALHLLRADVENVAYGPDMDYCLTLYAQRIDPDQDFYMMAPSVRAFLQVGRQWREVPLRALPGQEGQVRRVDGKRRFDYTFQVDATTFEELIPGYMHLRFTSTMLVGRSSDPSDGLYERTDDYYVYVKPRGTSDEAILKRTKYPGKPPVWIPMPPH